MCDISKITKLKSKIIYKVVRSIGTEKKPAYLGYFSYFPVKIGRINLRAAKSVSYTQYDGRGSFNDNIIGRCSGFEDLEIAKLLYEKSVWPGTELAILKIKISAAADMPIMRGTGKRICDAAAFDAAAVFAGPVIESIKIVPPPKVKKVYPI